MDKLFNILIVLFFLLSCQEKQNKYGVLEYKIDLDSTNVFSTHYRYKIFKRETVFIYPSYYEPGKILEVPDYRPDGKWHAYYKDDTSKLAIVENIINGQRDREYFVFWKNRMFKEERYYVNGIKVGKWRKLHDNGQMKTEHSFKNGLRHGKSLYLSRHGILLKQEFWEDGKLIKVVKNKDKINS